MEDLFELYCDNEDDIYEEKLLELSTVPTKFDKLKLRIPPTTQRTKTKINGMLRELEDEQPTPLTLKSLIPPSARSDRFAEMLLMLESDEPITLERLQEKDISAELIDETLTEYRKSSPLSPREVMSRMSDLLIMLDAEEIRQQEQEQEREMSFEDTISESDSVESDSPADSQLPPTPSPRTDTTPESPKDIPPPVPEKNEEPSIALNLWKQAISRHLQITRAESGLGTAIPIFTPPPRTPEFLPSPPTESFSEGAMPICSQSSLKLPDEKMTAPSRKSSLPGTKDSPISIKSPLPISTDPKTSNFQINSQEGLEIQRNVFGAACPPRKGSLPIALTSNSGINSQETKTEGAAHQDILSPAHAAQLAAVKRKSSLPVPSQLVPPSRRSSTFVNGSSFVPPRRDTIGKKIALSLDSEQEGSSPYIEPASLQIPMDTLNWIGQVVIPLNFSMNSLAEQSVNTSVDDAAIYEKEVECSEKQNDTTASSAGEVKLEITTETTARPEETKELFQEIQIPRENPPLHTVKQLKNRISCADMERLRGEEMEENEIESTESTQNGGFLSVAVQVARRVSFDDLVRPVVQTVSGINSGQIQKALQEYLPFRAPESFIDPENAGPLKYSQKPAGDIFPVSIGTRMSSLPAPSSHVNLAETLTEVLIPAQEHKRDILQFCDENVLKCYPSSEVTQSSEKGDEQNEWLHESRPLNSDDSHDPLKRISIVPAGQSLPIELKTVEDIIPLQVVEEAGVFNGLSLPPIPIKTATFENLLVKERRVQRSKSIPLNPQRTSHPRISYNALSVIGK
ncbi:MAG: hypothetical protein SGCHY_000306 [Lobulomycetales sp.]